MPQSKYRTKRGLPEPEKSYYDLNGRKQTGRLMLSEHGNEFRVRQKAAPRKMGMFGFDGEIKSMYLATYGTPPYLQQYADYLNTPPAYYLADEVKKWEELTKKVAYPEVNDDILATHPFIPTLD